MADNEPNENDESTLLELQRKREERATNRGGPSPDAIDERIEEKHERAGRVREIASTRRALREETLTDHEQETLETHLEELVEVHNAPVRERIDELESEIASHEQAINHDRDGWEDVAERNEERLAAKRERVESLKQKLVEPEAETMSDSGSTEPSSPTGKSIDVRKCVNTLKSNLASGPVRREWEGINEEIEKHRDRAKSFEEKGNAAMAGDCRATVAVLEAYRDGEPTVEVLEGSPAGYKPSEHEAEAF